MNVRIAFALLSVVLASLVSIAQDAPREPIFDIGEIEVPDGDTVDVVEFLQEVTQLQRDIAADYRTAMAKVSAAQSAAANEILNAPEVSDEHFAIAAKFALTAKVRAVSNQPVAQQREVLEMVKRQLSLGVKKGVQRTELSNASMLASYLERGGNLELAAEACQSFADLLKEVTDPSTKSYALRFEGTARRLGLLGNPIELVGKQLDGTKFNWNSYQGKVVLVDFWATWCGPCLAEAPNVRKNYDKYHDRGFEVVGISLDTKKTALEDYIKSKNVPWVNLFEPGAGWKHPMAVKYGISAIPSVFLVNREGNVVSLRARGAELGKQLKRLLETKEDLERAIVEYSKQLGADPDDATLLSQRAHAYVATEQSELAAADWQAAVEIQPDLAQKAFADFKQAEQWSHAAEFGMMVVDQKPEDIMRWLRLSAVVAVSGDTDKYGEFCEKMVKQFENSEVWRESRITCKSCLLLPNAIPIDRLPRKKAIDGFEGEHSAYTLAWSWSVRALLAYRSGDGKSALECLKESEKNRPVPFARALNLSLLALTHFQLGNQEEADQAMSSATQLLKQLRADEASKYNHDVMIADVLFKEARRTIAANSK